MGRETLKKAEQMLALLMRWGSVICLVGLLFFVSAGVFVRFVPISSMGWADEIIEFGFAWMVFLGAAVLWRARSHFRVDVVPERLAGKKWGKGLEIFLGFLSLVFLLVFTYQGGLVALQATDRSPILEFPRTLWYMSIPISGAIMIGYTIRDLCLLFLGKFRR
ncbi:MAG: TRAP transporter small permease [Syntrophaceae bacterium]|nr:TRAP transporter small permease [Syntrophaceae bacterium]